MGMRYQTQPPGAYGRAGLCAIRVEPYFLSQRWSGEQEKCTTGTFCYGLKAPGGQAVRTRFTYIHRDSCSDGHNFGHNSIRRCRR